MRIWKYLVPTVIILLFVIFSYTLLHEGGHAVAVLLQGGQVTVFNINFITSSPHIQYRGDFSDMERAIVSIAGPLVPFLVWLPLVILLPRLRRSILQGTLLIYSMMIVGSLIPNIVLALLYWQGRVYPGEDVVRFLEFSGAHPLATAGLFLILTLFAVWYLLFVGKVVSLVRHWQKYFKSSVSPFVALHIGISVFVLSLVVAISLLLQSSAPHTFDLSSYDFAFDLSFKDINQEDTVIYQFSIEDPMSYDMAYALTTQDVVRLQLVNISGTGFLYRDGDVLEIYEGRGPLLNAQFTGFILQEGEYLIEIATEDRKGDLQVGISLNELEPAQQEYLDLLEAVQQRTFTTETYQDEGYSLLYHEPLIQGQDIVIYELSPRTSSYYVSVFVVGDYEELSLVYVDEKRRWPLLMNRDTTIGFGLPPSSYSGELLLSVTGTSGEIYLYGYDPK